MKSYAKSYEIQWDPMQNHMKSNQNLCKIIWNPMKSNAKSYERQWNPMQTHMKSNEIQCKIIWNPMKCNAKSCEIQWDPMQNHAKSNEFLCKIIDIQWNPMQNHMKSDEIQCKIIWNPMIQSGHISQKIPQLCHRSGPGASMKASATQRSTQRRMNSHNVPTQRCHTTFYTTCGQVTLSVKYSMLIYVKLC